jgi:hypothetical protein
MKLEDAMEHTKTHYFHSNKLVFEDNYLYGLFTINKSLDLQQYCV